MKTNNCFTAQIEVKPYIYAYLINKYGTDDSDVICLHKNKTLRKQFLTCLKGQSHRYDNRYKKLKRYNKRVSIIISEDEFTRYGHGLSHTETVNFGQIIENQIKEKMISWVTVHKAMGVSIAQSLIDFQLATGITENEWPLDSMRRDYNRKLIDINNFEGEKSIMQIMTEKMQQNLVQLSHISTIAQTLK